MRYLSALVAALILGAAIACAKSPAGPTTEPQPQGQSPSTEVVVTGHLTGTISGQPIGSATIDLDSRITTTAADGSFRYQLPAGSISSSPLLKITGANILDRWLRLTLTKSRDVTLDAIALGGGFDLNYYRKFVRDDLDSPGTMRSLRRWTQAPRLYIKTVDQAGTPIEPETLNPIVAALQDEASAWTGGRFGIAGVELGSDTREGVPGWITVKWVAPLTDETFCARAQVAVSGGWIEMNYLMPQGCSCRSARISTKTARHELGHAMGFYHTNEPDDVMKPTSACDDRRPSARERLHAAIAYSRSVGNGDPDIEPSGVLLSYGEPVVIKD